MHTIAEWLDRAILAFASNFEEGAFFAHAFNINAMLAIVLVSLVCGAMGTLVVGNRMAFFSDALAHCAWAGVAVGVLLFIALNVTDEFFRVWTLAIMVGFGIFIGVLITYVQNTSGLPSDTVIGVFFAGALGLGAIATRVAARHARTRSSFNIENFIFGDPLSVNTTELIWLFLLVVAGIAFLLRYYNDLVLSSVSASLAQSRRVPVHLIRYLFVILLGIVVNMCLHVVGALLINGMLLVPAAAAACMGRTLRQFFWWSVGLAAATGLLGQFLQWELNTRGVDIGISGTIVVLGVVLAIVLARGRTLIAGTR
jgi:zinc transport system permease protein